MPGRVCAQLPREGLDALRIPPDVTSESSHLPGTMADGQWTGANELIQAHTSPNTRSYFNTESTGHPPLPQAEANMPVVLHSDVRVHCVRALHIWISG